MEHRLDTARSAVFTAVVHDSHRVLFAAVSDTRTALIEQVANYVRHSASDLLYPVDALRVHRLIRTGHAEAAIEHYFASVGERWDDQWLITTGADAAAASKVAVCLDRVVPARAGRSLTVAG